MLVLDCAYSAWVAERLELLAYKHIEATLAGSKPEATVVPFTTPETQEMLQRIPEEYTLRPPHPYIAN